MKILTRPVWMLVFLYPQLIFAQTDDWDTSTPGQIVYTGGYVGIGNLSPQVPLDILRSAYNGNEKFIRLKVSDATNDYFQINNATTAGGQFIPMIKGHHETDNRVSFQLIGETSADMDNGSEPILGFSARVDNNTVSTRPLFQWSNFNVETMTMLPNGNLGIGTTTPEDKLTIDGHISTTKTYNTKFQFVRHGWSGSHGILFNSYYNPTVSGSLATTGNTHYANDEGSYSSGAGAIMFFSNGGTMDFRISEKSDGIDQPIEWGDPKMRIRRDGNVGIGTEDPISKLHVTTNEDALSWSLILNNTRNSQTLTEYGVGLKLKHSGNSEGYKWGGIASVQEEQWANSSGLALFANETEYMRIRYNGNVGIGTTNPSEKLDVNGTIRSKEVKVEATGWPDYVFESDYHLRTLEETEAYIQANKHLPEIPSAKEVEANGVLLGEMNMLLLKKIEELTLHQIEMMKIIKAQQKEINELKEN